MIESLMIESRVSISKLLWQCDQRKTHMQIGKSVAKDKLRYVNVRAFTILWVKSNKTISAQYLSILVQRIWNNLSQNDCFILATYMVNVFDILNFESAI